MIKVQGKSEKNDLKDAEHFWLRPYYGAGYLRKCPRRFEGKPRDQFGYVINSHTTARRPPSIALVTLLQQMDRRELLYCRAPLQQ